MKAWQQWPTEIFILYRKKGGDWKVRLMRLKLVIHLPVSITSCHFSFDCLHVCLCMLSCVWTHPRVGAYAYVCDSIMEVRG